MTDLAVAFGLVFLAELGDKSMLLAVAFAARYRPWPVIAGIGLAALTMLGVSTLVGAALGAALPERPLAVVAGLIFVGFAVWTLLDDEDAEEQAGRAVGGTGGASGNLRLLLGVTAAFIVAELGDKTMLATITLASTQAPLPTWLGASAGMTAASAIAVTVVAVIGSRLPARAVRLAAAGAFLAFGLLLLWDGVRA